MCVSSLFINSIKVYRIYNCRPYPWLTYLYTVATMMGHGHNEHNTNNRIRYSGHYPKDISPSLVPSSACQRRAFSYITQPLSLLTVISPNYHWSIVQILKKKLRGAHPCSPPDNDLIVSPFASVQKPGLHVFFRKDIQTSCCQRRLRPRGHRHKRRHFRVSWPLEEDWYPRILIPSTSEFSTFLHSRLPTNLLPCAPTPQWSRNLLSFV